MSVNLLNEIIRITVVLVKIHHQKILEHTESSEPMVNFKG